MQFVIRERVVDCPLPPPPPPPPPYLDLSSYVQPINLLLYQVFLQNQSWRLQDIIERSGGAGASGVGEKGERVPSTELTRRMILLL